MHRDPDIQNSGSFPAAGPIPVEILGMPGEVLPPSEPPASGPEGGDVASSGGGLRQIARVFIENKLAVIGLAVIIFMVLFCFIGPLLYHTNQVNGQKALSCTSVSSFCPPCGPAKGSTLGTDPDG